MKPVVKYVIPDVHMGSQHDGLDEIIKTHKRKNPAFAQAIKSGGLIIFVNTPMTRFKMYSESGEVVGLFPL